MDRLDSHCQETKEVGLGLELSSSFFREVVQPLIQDLWPDLQYSAGLLGHGSDVLGYDDELSRDHDWGPRCMIFLREREGSALLGSMTAEILQHVPSKHHGFALNRGGALRAITVENLPQYLHNYIGSDLHLSEVCPTLPVRDWLTIPQQKLRSLAAVHIFRDDLGCLEALQKLLARGFPRDVRIFMQIVGWISIGKQQAFVGRAGLSGDDLGSRLATMHCIRGIMHLGFLITPDGKHSFAPYYKWFGKGFSELPCARLLTPLLDKAAAADDWRTRQQALADAYEALGTAMEEEGYLPPRSIAAMGGSMVSQHWSREQLVYAKVDHICDILFQELQDESLREMLQNPGCPKGSIEQVCGDAFPAVFLTQSSGMSYGRATSDVHDCDFMWHHFSPAFFGSSSSALDSVGTHWS